jgi:hypothetical protein
MRGAVFGDVSSEGVVISHAQTPAEKGQNL